MSFLFLIILLLTTSQIGFTHHKRERVRHTVCLESPAKQSRMRSDSMKAYFSPSPSFSACVYVCVCVCVCRPDIRFPSQGHFKLHTHTSNCTHTSNYTHTHFKLHTHTSGSVPSHCSLKANRGYCKYLWKEKSDKAKTGFLQGGWD